MTPPPASSSAESASGCLWEALALPRELRLAAADEAARVRRELGATVTLEAAGVATQLEVAAGEVESLWLPLALALQARQHAAQRRILVGVAGGAGTGKTVLSEVLCRVLRVLAGREIAVAVSMDGYHFPNAHLDAHVGREGGREVRLREIKGRPPTFDVAAFGADLARLRTPAGQAQKVRLPAYDRKKHEPVPAALAVQPHHQIVIVEGLHLLRSEPGWEKVRDGLDTRLLLELPLATCRARVVARKVAGGRTPADAEAHFERVDRPTIEELREPAQRTRADLVIQLAEIGGPAAERSRLTVAGCERRERRAQPGEFRAIPAGAVRLLAVGLNPALQKTLVFARWERGEVNRARTTLTSVGGKGQQFSRAASQVIPGGISLAQFLGGDNGARLGEMIAAAGVTQLTVAVPGETRCCHTVIDTARGEATELVEPSPPIPPAQVAELAARVLAVLAQGDIAGLAICGTYPPGVDADFYAALARHKGRALLLLDSYQGIGATLATGQVDILKLNADEVRSLAARSGTAETGAPDRPRPLPEVAAEVLAAHPLRWLAVTDGPRTAWLFEPAAAEPAGRGARVSRYYEYDLPVVDGVINPIGAGDTVAAVFLAQLAAGEAAPVAWAGGLAAGSASCRQLGGADFALADLREILAGIRVTSVTRWQAVDAG
jgi:fructose-1-phosphate kinase PfkB-like protein/pantothenate kinase